MLLSKRLIFTLTASLLLFVASENKILASDRGDDKDQQNPPSSTPHALLSTYEFERLRVEAILDRLDRHKGLTKDDGQETKEEKSDDDYKKK